MVHVKKMDSGGDGVGDSGGKLKALPKNVATSVGQPSGFSLFQCTKARKDIYKIWGLGVKHLALNERKFNQHLVVMCSLLDQKPTISSQAQIDNEAYGFAFVDENFARLHNIPLYDLNISRSLEVIDGRPIECADIRQII